MSLALDDMRWLLWSCLLLALTNGVAGTTQWRTWLTLASRERLVWMTAALFNLTVAVGAVESLALGLPAGVRWWAAAIATVWLTGAVLHDPLNHLRRRRTTTRGEHAMKTTLWARTKAKLQELRYTEPAILRARYVAIVGVLATLGVTLPGVVDHWVGVGLAVVAIAAPYYQGRKTRDDVWSQQTVDDLAALVALFPDLADKAKEMLGRGISVGIVQERLEQLAGSHRHLTTDPTS